MGRLSHVIVRDLVARSFLGRELLLLLIKHVHTTDVVFRIGSLTVFLDRDVPSFEASRALPVIFYRSINRFVDPMGTHDVVPICHVKAFLELKVVG